MDGITILDQNTVNVVLLEILIEQGQCGCALVGARSGGVVTVCHAVGNEFQFARSVRREVDRPVLIQLLA